MSFAAATNLPPVRQAAGIQYRESGRGDAPAVVLLHGIGSTSASWCEQFAPLGEGLRVVAWSAPGYEKSVPLKPEAPSAEEYAAALGAMLDAIGVREADLVTNSWGTLVALAFAARHPGRVRSLVLGGATAGSHGLAPEDQAKRTAERIERVRKLGMAPMREQDAPRLVSRNASPKALAWAGGASGEYPTEEGYCQASRMLYATDGVALIRGLGQRVLLVSGTEDIITPPELNAKKLAAAARDAKIEWIEGSGHLPHLENPGRFNAAVLGFIAKK